MSAESERFTPKQLLAIAMYAQGKRTPESAQEIKISVSALERWKAAQDFKSAIRARVRETCTLVMDEIVDASREALSYLRQVVTSDGASEQGRIRAAIAILDNLRTWREIDTEERIEALESRMNKQNGFAQSSYANTEKN